jgi:hypothetical protein
MAGVLADAGTLLRVKSSEFGHHILASMSKRNIQDSKTTHKDKMTPSHSLNPELGLGCEALAHPCWRYKNSY